MPAIASAISALPPMSSGCLDICQRSYVGNRMWNEDIRYSSDGRCDAGGASISKNRDGTLENVKGRLIIEIGECSTFCNGLADVKAVNASTQLMKMFLESILFSVKTC